MNALPRLALASLSCASLSFVSLWILVLPGCTVGPTMDSVAPARTGEGIDVVFSTVSTPDSPGYGRVKAELLEVRDNALLVRVQTLRTESLALVSYGAIEEARFDGMKRLSFGDGAAPSPVQREELRLLSRYPQGVSDELLQKLLVAYHQDELRTIP